MGEVETEDGVLVIKRIRVTYHLTVPEGTEDVARRVHEMHHAHCPVYRTVSGCIDVSTELVIEAV